MLPETTAHWCGRDSRYVLAVVAVAVDYEVVAPRLLRALRGLRVVGGAPAVWSATPTTFRVATHKALSPDPSLYTGVLSLSSSSCGLLSTSWFILRFAVLSTPFSLRIINTVQTRTATAVHAARHDSREMRNVVFFVKVVNLAVPTRYQTRSSHRVTTTYPLERTALLRGISP